MPDAVNTNKNPVMTNVLGSMKSTSLNIPELLMSVQLDRISHLDDQIKMQTDEMSKRNDWLKQSRDVLTQLNNNRPTKAGGTSDVLNYGTVTVDGRKISVEEWAKQNGIALPSKGDKPTQENFDAVIASVKGGMDTVNSQSQLDMVRLQSLMDKRNNGFDMLTNLTSKIGKSLDAITGNMR